MSRGASDEPPKLLKSVSHDAGRHFFDAPATMSLDACMLRLSSSSGARDQRPGRHPDAKTQRTKARSDFGNTVALFQIARVSHCLCPPCIAQVINVHTICVVIVSPFDLGAVRILMPIPFEG